MKRILITGSTDGIGFETAKMMAKEGHHIILHGRNTDKLEQAKKELKRLNNKSILDTVVCDLSILSRVHEMVSEINSKYDRVDVLINNAGIYVTDHTKTLDNLDVRFAVNTISPYILYKGLLGLMDKDSRVINLSSAAQAPVDLMALKEFSNMNDSDAYAQSKLAITMWSIEHGLKEGPMILAVNPKSFLGSKMVKRAYGREGFDLSIGAKILFDASLSDDFKNASGMYYDNDIQEFSNPHPHAMKPLKRVELIKELEDLINQ